MDLTLGIVGLPNAGKSTLFNALANKSVPVEIYPFTTINPNVGLVPLMDQRLSQIANAEGSKGEVPAVIKFVDIAGLVKGASKGEGLGNQFLAHIREVNAIVHLIRIFIDKNVSHVNETIDPKRDKEIIETELIIKDTETVERKLQDINIKTKGNNNLKDQSVFLQKLLDHLEGGKLAYSYPESTEEESNELKKSLSLLTDKPMLYVVNASQENIDQKSATRFKKKLNLTKDQMLIIIDAKLEEDISKLGMKEQTEFMKDLGIEESSLDKLIQASFNILNLISFFTANKNEARATIIIKGDNIIKAAAAIHTDFSKKFITTDVATFEDFVKFGGWQGCKEAGKVRLEGRDYIVDDGDVIQIRHGA